jgi:glycopeptide antibiotics resistance protein
VTPARSGGRALLVALFALYLVLLVWVVLWKLDVPYIGGVWREVTLVPFATGHEGGVKSPFELAVNIVLFVPFGAYLGVLAPSWRWWKVGGVVAGASLVLETAQYALAVGSSDITDVILNTAGGLTGYALLALARRRLQDRTVTVMARVLAAGTALSLIAIALFIASPIRYGPPRDGMPPQDGDVLVGSTP